MLQLICNTRYDAKRREKKHLLRHRISHSSIACPIAWTLNLQIALHVFFLIFFAWMAKMSHLIRNIKFFCYIFHCRNSNAKGVDFKRADRDTFAKQFFLCFRVVYLQRDIRTMCSVVHTVTVMQYYTKHMLLGPIESVRVLNSQLKMICVFPVDEIQFNAEMVANEYATLKYHI